MVKRIDVLLFNGESNVSCVRATDYDALALKFGELGLKAAANLDAKDKRIAALEAALRKLGYAVTEYVGTRDPAEFREMQLAEFAARTLLGSQLPITTPYPWCRQKAVCAGKGSCPLEISCGD
jgi:hypothetical protein